MIKFLKNACGRIIKLQKLQLIVKFFQTIAFGNLNQNAEIEILRNYNFDFMRILESPSIILLGKNRIWELMRGVYNENFNSLTSKIEEKALIKRLWNFIYDELKKRIWIPRCEEIKRLEDAENIKKLDLRKKKRVLSIEETEREEEEGIKKLQKKKKTEKFRKIK